MGEVAGEASASVARFLVKLKHALFYVGVGLSGLVFGGSGLVLQSFFAVLWVALDPLAHALRRGVPASCGFAVIARLVVGLDDAFAGVGWVDGRNLPCREVPSLACLLFCELQKWFGRGCVLFFRCG